MKGFSDIFKNMHFVCDVTDFHKQSVEATLKILKKSLKIVSDEVYFVVNLYSFS